MKPTTRFSLILFFIVQSFVIAQQYVKVNINNVSTYVWNDGRMDGSPLTFKQKSPFDLGFEYPKGSKINNVRSSGILWGGYIKNELRVGGTQFLTTLTPGRIVDGSENLQINDKHIYRIRPDYLTFSLSSEFNDESITEEILKERYRNDYENWSVTLGAPYIDVNNDGKYTSWIDKPGFYNADQTIWFVCNDQIAAKNTVSTDIYKTKKTNVEVQATIWAYSKYDLLKSTIFKKYKVINRSKTETIKDMYIAIYSDADMGDGWYNLVGCDSTLGIGYIYNEADSDYRYGNNLPVYAIILLQGAIVNSEPIEYAFVNGKKILGKKDLGMSSFNNLIWGNGDWPSPKPTNYYNALQGLSFFGRLPFVNPITNQQTKFPQSGYPPTNTGWLDKPSFPRQNRDFQINTGPFNLMPGEFQEIIFAQIITTSTNRMGNISYIKYLAKYVKDFYQNEMFKNVAEISKPTEIPMRYSLSQNYPNPFNPSTTIEYTIPNDEIVTLKVFDVLGREVATLVNEYKHAGTYKVNFNVKTRHGASLQSGVYFYQLRTGDPSAGSGHGFVETKKLILMK